MSDERNDVAQERAPDDFDRAKDAEYRGWITAMNLAADLCMRTPHTALQVHDQVIRDATRRAIRDNILQHIESYRRDAQFAPSR